MLLLLQMSCFDLIMFTKPLLLIFALNFAVWGQKWEFQRYDGWYNNLAHPEWGAAGKKEFLILLEKFDDNFENCDI